MDPAQTGVLDAQKLIRVRHGSKDSIDIDVVYVTFDPLPDRQACLQFCNTIREENRNIFHVDKSLGVVVNVLKGTPSDLDAVAPQPGLAKKVRISGRPPEVSKRNKTGSIDECNNGLLRTYVWHQQNFQFEDFPIKRAVLRNPILKVARCFRSILSRFTRLNGFRQICKDALNSGDLAQYASAMQQIDLSRVMDEDNITDVPKQKLQLGTRPADELIDVDAAKGIAFQLGQTAALINGVELFTKSEIAQYYPEMEPALYRKQAPKHTLPALEAKKYLLVSLFSGDMAPFEVKSYKLETESKVKKIHGVSFTVVHLRSDNKADHSEALAVCDGAVIDTNAGSERSIFFPGWRLIDSCKNLSSIWGVFLCQGRVIWLQLRTGLVHQTPPFLIDRGFLDPILSVWSLIFALEANELVLAAARHGLTGDVASEERLKQLREALCL